MGDVLTLPGAGSNTGIPAPYLQSTIYPVDNGFGGNVALGMGSQTRRFQDIVSEEGQVSVSSAQLQSLFMAINQIGLDNPQSVNFNFEGLRGPPGIPGQTIVNQGRSGTLGGVGSSGDDGADGADGADGLDAFDNIDIPIPYDGWEGAFTDDDPDPGKISWTSFKVKYQGTEYTVAANAAGTDNSYLYWDKNDTPTSLLPTNTLITTEGVEKWPVCVNNNGTAEPVNFIKAIVTGLIKANTILASQMSVTDLVNIAGLLTLGLGGDTRLRINGSGIYTSINAGGVWTEFLYNDGGVVKVSADLMTVGKVIAGVIETATLTGVSTTIGSTKSLNLDYAGTESVGASDDQNTDYDATNYGFVDFDGQTVIIEYSADVTGSAPISGLVTPYVKNTGGSKVWTGSSQALTGTEVRYTSAACDLVNVAGLSVDAKYTPGLNIRAVSGVGGGGTAEVYTGKDLVSLQDTGTLTKA
jgi:hypothetical protein